MEDQIVSIEVAKLAKEKGFNWEVRHFYYNEFGNNELAEFLYYQMERNYFNYTGYPEDLLYMAPTQSLLQRWLREIYNIEIFITKPFIGSDDQVYSFLIEYEKGIAKKLYNRIRSIDVFTENPGGTYSGGWYTYEETLEQALLEALKLINNENKNSQ